MEIKNINSFLKTAEYGSFTRAAAALGYSKGAVTAHIHQLEDELGIKLFINYRQRMLLTEAGRAFIPLAQKIHDACEEAKAFADSRQNMT